MPRTRYAPRPTPSLPGEPFESCEAAWFWAVETHDNMLGGARMAAGLAEVPRPCDARDVLGAALRLHRGRTLSRGHVDVLFRYGRRQWPPDPRVDEERACVRLWEEALARLEPELVRKGIVDHAQRNKS